MSLGAQNFLRVERVRSGLKKWGVTTFQKIFTGVSAAGSPHPHYENPIGIIPLDILFMNTVIVFIGLGKCIYTDMGPS
jgi:hypothetical protein